ncbi:acetoacetyl-CoA synthase [Halomonas litopenaei]|nr:acetoacetyl-CoA synthase [Halomonas litopenaei]
MQTLYDQDAPKRATNLSIIRDLLQRERSMNVNLSATREKAREAKLSESEAEQWQGENSNAIKAYNAAVSEHGCFAEEYRTF